LLASIDVETDIYENNVTNFVVGRLSSVHKCVIGSGRSFEKIIVVLVSTELRLIIGTEPSRVSEDVITHVPRSVIISRLSDGR